MPHAHPADVVAEVLGEPEQVDRVAQGLAGVGRGVVRDEREEAARGGSRGHRTDARARPEQATHGHVQVECMHSSYDAVMTVITVRDVPDEVRDELAARAGRSGMSMQEFLRAHLIDLTARPSPSDALAQVRSRTRLPAALRGPARRRAGADRR